MQTMRRTAHALPSSHCRLLGDIHHHLIDFGWAPIASTFPNPFALKRARVVGLIVNGDANGIALLLRIPAESSSFGGRVAA